MSKTYSIKVHEIKTDGLPPRDLEKAGLVGRVAFIWDGAIVSGWPTELDDPSDPESMKWETSEDALGTHELHGVKYWVELQIPTWEMEKS